MIEKVNPMHPDKIADRIAGSIEDYIYLSSDEATPKMAVEVLIGHGVCTVVTEGEIIPAVEIEKIVHRVTKDNSIAVRCLIRPQDQKLSKNQDGKERCGDNGIFRGVPLTQEQKDLSRIASEIYEEYPTDGKYILDGKKLIICQSCANSEKLRRKYEKDYDDVIVNPLGEWTGGLDVDTGATNRKLGSDMADSATGGGLHGKDFTKADLTLSIYAFTKAQLTGQKVEISCAIGDEYVDGIPYSELVRRAKDYVNCIGGFEALAEWGLF